MERLRSNILFCRINKGSRLYNYTIIIKASNSFIRIEKNGHSKIEKEKIANYWTKKNIEKYFIIHTSEKL
jgi:hypothetical protein